MNPEAGFLVVPPDAPPFDWSAVVPVVCSSLDQVAALVEVHDGVSCSEIRLEGTSFRVRLAGARRLESVFSPKEERKYSELERSEIANRNARKWFEESRAAAGSMLRDAHKAQTREAKRKKTPVSILSKVGPSVEETLLRRRLDDALRAQAAAEAKAEDLVGIVRTLTAASESAPMDDDTEEKALFLIHHWEDLPIEALRWIVDQERAA